MNNLLVVSSVQNVKWIHNNAVTKKGMQQICCTPFIG